MASETNWEIEASTLKNEATLQKEKDQLEIARLKEDISNLNKQACISYIYAYILVYMFLILWYVIGRCIEGYN